MNIGDKIENCYMHGIGELDNMNHVGVIEWIGRDYVIVRDTENDQPIFVHKTIKELEKFL